MNSILTKNQYVNMDAFIFLYFAMSLKMNNKLF
jgi:hypothetical protein